MHFAKHTLILNKLQIEKRCLIQWVFIIHCEEYTHGRYHSFIQNIYQTLFCGRHCASHWRHLVDKITQSYL